MGSEHFLDHTADILQVADFLAEDLTLTQVLHDAPGDISIKKKEKGVEHGLDIIPHALGPNLLHADAHEVIVATGVIGVPHDDLTVLRQNSLGKAKVNNVDQRLPVYPIVTGLVVPGDQVAQRFAPREQKVVYFEVVVDEAR